MYESEGKVQFTNTAVTEWLINAKTAEDCAVDLDTGKEKLAELCLKWLDDLLDEDRR